MTLSCGVCDNPFAPVKGLERGEWLCRRCALWAAETLCFLALVPEELRTN